jgi:hypothetical protein
MENKFCRMQ